MRSNISIPSEKTSEANIYTVGISEILEDDMSKLCA